MKPQIHHIKQQKLQFHFKEQSAAFRWNREGANFFNREIVPPLTSIFDELFPAHHHLVVERLEVDIGVVSEDALKSEILKALSKKLKGIQITGPGNIKTNHRDTTEDISVSETTIHVMLLDYLIFFLRYGVLPWNSFVDNLEKLESAILEKIIAKGDIQESEAYRVLVKMIRRPSTRYRLHQQFSESFSSTVFEITSPLYLKLKVIAMAFIQIVKALGRAVNDGKQLVDRLESSPLIWFASKEKSLDDQSIIRFVNWLLVTVSASYPDLNPGELAKEMIEKMLEQKRQNQHQELLQLLANFPSVDNSGRRESDKTDLTHLESSEGEETGSEHQQENIGKDDIPKNKLAKPKTDAQREIGQTPSPADGKSPNEETSATSNEKKRFNDEDKNKVLPEQAVEPEPQSDKSKLVPGQSSILSVKDDSMTDPVLAKGMDSNQFAESKPGVGTSETETDQPTEPEYPVEWWDEMEYDDMPEDYYLLNAGLVLCWPYLATLFDRLQYVRKKQWIDVKNQERAIQLVGFLASGKMHQEEPELLLPKFMCGWPLSKPVARSIELNQAETDQAEHMLEALISNWKILKTTSVMGLRDGFLLREGKLFKEDKLQWRLIVEQKSIDLLLDHLPYTISVIKLPWIKPILKVDWA